MGGLCCVPFETGGEAELVVPLSFNFGGHQEGYSSFHQNQTPSSAAAFSQSERHLAPTVLTEAEIFKTAERLVQAAEKRSPGLASEAAHLQAPSKKGPGQLLSVVHESPDERDEEASRLAYHPSISSQSPSLPPPLPPPAKHPVAKHQQLGSIADDRGTPELAYASRGKQPELAPEESEGTTYSVEVDKSDGGNLGWDFDVLDRDRFIITSIWKDGLIDNWNCHSPPPRQVRPMDRLVMVNGQSGTIDYLMQKLDNQQQLKLTLTRPRELHVTLEKSSRKPLGVSLGVDDFSMGILVMNVKDGGALKAWNDQSRENAVSASDRIISVNGHEDSGRRLLQMISDSDVLHLKVLSWSHDAVLISN